MSRSTPILAACVVGLMAAPAAAKEPGKPGIGAELDTAVENALRTLERFIDAFPGYEAPVVTPEGDIIIRRKRPKPSQDAPPPVDQRDT